MLFDRLTKPLISGVAITAIGLLLVFLVDLFTIGTLLVAVGVVWIALGFVLALLGRGEPSGGPRDGGGESRDLTEAEIEAAEEAEREIREDESLEDPFEGLSGISAVDPILGARPAPQQPEWASDEDELWPDSDEQR